MILYNKYYFIFYFLFKKNQENMTLKINFFKALSDKKENIEIKYQSSKIIFILFSFIFFLNFYLVWSWIWKNFLEKFLSPSYILFLISINIYTFYLWQKIFSEKKLFSYIFFGIWILISIFFILPVIL